MGSIEAALQLAVILATASLQPGPLTLDPSADVRMSLLAQPASISQPAGDETLVRWQQSGDEIPSDLPDATEETDEDVEEEPLDVPLEEDDELLDVPIEGDEEVLDAPLDEELIDATVEEEEPLDVALDGELPADDVIDLPVEDPEPVAEVPLPVAEAPVAAPKATLTLPPDFGAGDTIVLNPTGGNTAEVPEDCKVLVQNGRAVVGSGCGGGGEDDGPWWGSQVGVLPAPSSTTSAGVPTGFPFDEAPSSAASSSPFGEGFPFNDGGAVITQPAPAANDASEAPQVISAGPVEDSDEEPRSFFNSNRDDDDERRRATRVGRVTPARAAQSVRAIQPARAPKTARANTSERNPCQTAQVVAKKAKSKKHIVKARARCRQYKRAKRQARSEQPLVNDVRFI